MVDTRDLKSLGQKRLCGFESRFEHRKSQVAMQPATFLLVIISVRYSYKPLIEIHRKNTEFLCLREHESHEFHEPKVALVKPCGMNIS